MTCESRSKNWKRGKKIDELSNVRLNICEKCFQYWIDVRTVNRKLTNEMFTRQEKLKTSRWLWLQPFPALRLGDLTPRFCKMDDFQGAVGNPKQDP